jgi:hypothetical protein
MINFLVKLANLLDTRGQYNMAREVDDLISKFAQQSVEPEQLQSVQPEPNQSLPNQSFEPEPVNPESLMSVQPPQENKPAKKAPRRNPLVMQLQKALNSMGSKLKEDGLWGKETNRAFIAAMNSYPEYAKLMTDGHFIGTMQEAVQKITQLSTLKDMETPQESAPAKAPAAEQMDDAETPGQNLWKSKWHKMTPAAISYLQRLEKMRPGSGQNAVTAIDKVPSQTQKDFEDYLKDMAESAEDTSGMGRLGDSFRRR